MRLVPTQALNQLVFKISFSIIHILVLHVNYLATRVVESEDFLGFRLQQFWKTELRLQQFWKTDSDSSSFEKPTPTPAVLKNRLRLQQFWKTDSDSSSFEKPTPTPAVLKNRLRLQQF